MDIDGDRIVVQQRRSCPACGRTETIVDPDVIPRLRYSRQVITGVVRRRHQGTSWEECTATFPRLVKLTVTTVRRWAKRVEVAVGDLAEGQPAMLFRRGGGVFTLCTTGGRSPDPSQEDPWECPQRSPPRAQP